jgi:hypothetical protein
MEEGPRCQSNGGRNFEQIDGCWQQWQPHTMMAKKSPFSFLPIRILH